MKINKTKTIPKKLFLVEKIRSNFGNNTYGIKK